MVVLRLVAMGVEVPGCYANLRHESRVDSRRRNYWTSKKARERDWAPPAQLAGLSEAAHDHCPSNLRAYWSL